MEAKTTSRNRFPEEWDETRVQEVIAHYDQQTEDEELAELEAAQQGPGVTMLAVPTEMVAEIQALITRKQSA